MGKQPQIYLRQLQLGPMANYVYLIGDPATHKAVVIDPAWDVAAVLDEAARDLIRRAQPLPPVPADYPGERLDLIVPVVFSLH